MGDGETQQHKSRAKKRDGMDTLLTIGAWIWGMGFVAIIVLGIVEGSKNPDAFKSGPSDPASELPMPYEEPLAP